MSCFFCDSNYHLSENCDRHVSDESRKEIARLKECCEHCLNYIGEKQFDALFERSRCFKCTKSYKDKCRTFGNCFTCFSTDHYTVFCSNRSTAPQSFIPNIDKILLPHFLQMFNPFEQYPLTFSSPETLNLIPLKNLKVIKNSPLSIFNYSKFDYKNFVLIGTIRFVNADSVNIKHFFNHIATKIIAVKAEMIVVDNSKISFCEFLLLLSPHTKTLICNDVTFTSPSATINLKEIFEHLNMSKC